MTDASRVGAAVWLEKAPLKYEGLSYTEIWISEAQERMVLAVPPHNWERLKQLCAAENVEAAAIGGFQFALDGREAGLRLPAMEFGAVVSDG